MLLLSQHESRITIKRETVNYSFSGRRVAEWPAFPFGSSSAWAQSVMMMKSSPSPSARQGLNEQCGAACRCHTPNKVLPSQQPGSIAPATPDRQETAGWVEWTGKWNSSMFCTIAQQEGNLSLSSGILTTEHNHKALGSLSNVGHTRVFVLLNVIEIKYCINIMK